MVITDPIHPGGSPQDIRKQEIFQKNLQLATKIQKLLDENKINYLDVAPDRSHPIVGILLKDNAKDEEIKNIGELLKANGAKQDNKISELFSMGNIDIFIYTFRDFYSGFEPRF